MSAGTGELLNVLIVDDSVVNCRLMSAMLRKMGYFSSMVEGGSAALALCEQKIPDLVLMDVQMPGMSGFDAVREMRRRYETWFPILFLSAQAANQKVVEGLRAGGDDYLFKPVNFEILQAKIRQFQIRLEQSKRLVEYRARIEEETVAARAFIERFTAIDKISDPRVRFLLKPAENFSGDLIAFARSPDNGLHVLLADSAGHGLTAALAVIPITKPFYQMTAKGFDITAILLEINCRVREYLPLPRFVAAAMLSINPDTGVIQVWNGGLPSALLLDSDGIQVVHSFESRHLPLGVLDSDKFDAGLEYYMLADRSCHLLLCSDGATEIKVDDGRMLGQSGLLREAQQQSSSVPLFDRVVGAIENHLAGQPPVDDIALIMVDCQPVVTMAPPYPTLQIKKLDIEPQECGHSGVEVHEWEVSLLLKAQQLKHPDVVPFLLDVVRQIEGRQTDSKLFLNGRLPKIAVKHEIEGRQTDSKLFLVLSELFSNALDYGVLKLDSAMKDQPDGMDIYFAERTARLAGLEAGQITLRFERINCKSCGCLKISVSDSGDGFDFSRIQTIGLHANQQRHGRGIALVGAVCNQLKYFGNGSEAVAYLAI